MKTIKLPYKTEVDLIPIFKQYSIIVKYAYNRFLDNKSEKDIRKLTKSLNNIELLNSWLIQCAIREAYGIFKRFNDQKVIFGGKYNYSKLVKNKITKEEYKLKRLSPLNVQGEKAQKGNRSFNLDIINNNKIIFKQNRNNHIKFNLPNLRNNIKRELFKLQELNESEGYTYSVRFDLKYVYISFEEFKNDNKNDFKLDNYIGIDLNPNAIGISIHNNGNIIHTQEFNLKPIFDKIFSEKLSSDSKRMKYFQNKLDFETLEISKQISKLAKYYKCKSVFIEDLNFKIGDSGKGRVYNRKTKNLWKKERFITNLNKRLNMNNIDLYKVNPAYTSFIGNMQYDYTDPINASIEIARRGYEFRIKKNTKGFYPIFLVKHRWKEMATKHKNWKDLYREIVKNSKLKYRVSLDDIKYDFKVFQQNSRKSMIINYVLYR